MPARKGATVDSTTDVVIQDSAANGERGDLLGREYAVEVTVVGTTPMLMHRYDVEAVKSKGRAAKNSAEKKSDDLESYVTRDPDDRRQIGVEGSAIKACLREAARSVPDPRSPRKSARDLVATGIRVEPFVVRLGKTTWDYVDERRVRVQGSAVARQRPAFKEGWKLTFRVIVLAGEYIDLGWLSDLVTRAGRFQGLLDARQIGYGLFRVESIKRIALR